MTRTELISAPASWTQCVFKTFFFISLHNFNQLDATSKVMYRHEIICTGNTVYFKVSKFTINNDQLSVSRICCEIIVQVSSFNI